MDMFGFYKEIYLFEMERKDKLTASISTPVSILIASIVGWTYMIMGLKGISTANEIFIVVMFGISFCFVVAAVMSLIRQNHGFEYGYLHTPASLEEYKKKLYEYACENFSDEKESKSLELLEIYILNQIISHASRNGANNDSRSSNIFSANLFMVISLIPLGFGYIVFIFDYLGGLTKP